MINLAFCSDLLSQLFKPEATVVLPPHETPETPTTIFVLGANRRTSLAAGGTTPSIGFRILTSARKSSLQVTCSLAESIWIFSKFLIGSNTASIDEVEVVCTRTLAADMIFGGIVVVLVLVFGRFKRI